MSVYTVREVTGNAKAHAHLETRGLNARSVSMTSLDPIALADYPQIAYHTYTRLLPAFMLATKLQQTVTTTRPGYNLLEKAGNSITIVYPPLCIMFQNKLTAEEQENIKVRGAAIIPAKKEEDTMYSFSGKVVTQELLLTMYRHNKKVKLTNPCPFGATNLGGYQSLFKVLAIVTWFLKTHSYPAFVGPVDSESEEGGRYDTIEGFISAKRKGDFGSRTITKRLKEAEDDQNEDVEMKDDDEETGLDEYTIGDAETKIPKAKPSTPPTHIIGTVNDLPTLPGICFPFFEDMLETDPNFVSSVIRTYFLECLGDTRAEVLSGYRNLKGNMGSIASTLTGRVLQHIFCGMKLSIEAQARLFIIMDGERYLGFTLHGWYFTVSLDGYKHVPLPHKELVEKVRLVDEHSVAIAHILQKLSKMKINGKVVAKKVLTENKIDVGKNPRKLAKLIRRFDLEEREDIEEIEKLATKLSFPQRYWDMSDHQKILDAVDLLLSSSFPEDDAPMYPRGGTLTTKNPNLSIFALFGDSGFSFRAPGGKPSKIPADRTTDTLYKAYKGKNNKEVKPNPTIVVVKKSLGLCVDDWSSFLADKMFINRQSRDAAFRSCTFGGNRARELWMGLIDRIGPLTESSAVNVSAEEVEIGDEIIGNAATDSFLDFL